MTPQRQRNNKTKTPSKGTPNRQHPAQQLPAMVPATTPQQQVHSTPTSNLGMTTAQRYDMNLKLMRRREPTITSIFDQFDHVCVYKIDQNGKWDKAGYEGSMFLFESTTYPPYGIYILNRSGSRDLVQRLYPEDVLKVSGSILAIKHYKAFSKNRMEAVKAQHGDIDQLHPFHPGFIVPDVENLGVDVKGEHEMIGFWKHEAGNRTSMIEVVQRLHACIMKNQPYPEAWRYGPNHPPPHHRLQMVPHRSSGGTSSASASASEAESDAGDPPPASEVDLLFAKLMPTPVVSHSVAAVQPQQQQQPHTPSAVDSLFAKITSTHPAPMTPGPAPLPPSTGITLLDNIFASAQAQPPQQQALEPIHAPQPSTTHQQQQQVLNENVISILLGLPPSRTASAAGSATTSRDGDNESESSDYSNHSISDRKDSNNRMMLSVPPTNGKHTAVKGDATPRGFATLQMTNGHHASGVPVPSRLESTSSVSTVRGSSSSHQAPPVQQQQNRPSQPQKPRVNRQLVPFEDESELWPYTPSSGNENGGVGGNANGTAGSDDPDIVELDFAETSLLSDPEGFRKLNRKQQHQQQPQAEGAQSTTRKSRNRTRKSRRERNGQQTMEEIERGWDLPDHRSAYLAGQRASEQDSEGGVARMAFVAPPPPASPSPPPEVMLRQRLRTPSPVGNAGGKATAGAPQDSTKTPTMGSRVQQEAAGRGVPPTPSSKGKGKNGAVLNGTLVDREALAASLLESMKTKGLGMVQSKEVFAKELVALLQSDQSFVEEVYQRYASQTA